MISKTTILAITVVGVSAQGGLTSLLNISPSCQSALSGILTGPAGTCLGATGLANIAMTNGNQSLITPIDSWLTTTCAQPACTNATIDAVIANVTSGCRSELDRWNVSDEQVQTVKGYIEEFYPVGRRVACLKDSNASDQFCFTEALKKIESATGRPLTPNNLQEWESTAEFQPNSALMKNLTCADCTKAAWAIIKPYLGVQAQSKVESQVDQTCGSGFATGPAPVNVHETANTATAELASSPNGATSVLVSTASVVLGAVGALLLMI